MRLGRRVRRRALVGAVVAALALWLGAPRVLGHLRVFRLRQVELVGVRHLAPGDVIGALRLADAATIFADVALLADRVRGMRGVAAARVERRLPATLRVLVREVEPVALVPGSRGLVPIDAAGRALPFDPARSALDLPIALAADSAVASVLALVQAADPALFRNLTAARRMGRGDVVLEFESRRVLLRSDAGPEVIRAVVLVMQDLGARTRAFAELDARYAGQVVVRRGRGRRA